MYFYVSYYKNNINFAHPTHWGVYKKEKKKAGASKLLWTRPLYII